jgi:tRNA (cmo5U34)-methyltransferase
MLVSMKILARPSFQSESPDAYSQFDLIAPFYPALEQCIFGSKLDKARQTFFETVLQADRILLVGEGNGRFLKSLLSQKQSGGVVVIEKSAAMIRLAQRRVGELGNLRCDLKFIQSDLRDCPPVDKFDCVVTHFFIDVFNPPAQRSVIRKIRELSTPNGTWINVDFLPARTWRGSMLMWAQYTFFRVISRIEAKRCFDELPAAVVAGWRLAESIPHLGGLVVAKRYQKGPVPVDGDGTRTAV